MQYILLFIIPLFTSLTRILLKKFKETTKGIEQASNIYIIVTCVFAMIVFAILAKGKLTPNLPTILYSIAMAVFSTLSSILLLLALDKTNVANTTMFSGAGIIVIPFLFGTIFLKEEINISKILTFFILLSVILMPLLGKKQEDSKNSFLGFIYCILLFFNSGFSTVLFKLYADAKNVLDANVFCFWTNVFMFPVVLVIALRNNAFQLLKDIKKIKPMSYTFAISVVIFSNFATLLQVIILKDINITVFTLLNSPSALIMTAFISWGLFKEKITKRMALSISLSILGIILSVI